MRNRPLTVNAQTLFEFTYYASKNLFSYYFFIGNVTLNNAFLFHLIIVLHLINHLNKSLNIEKTGDSFNGD